MNKGGNIKGNVRGNVKRCHPRWIDRVREITKDVNAEVAEKLKPIERREKKVTKRRKTRKKNTEE